jgi:hypothetical protein
VYNKEGKLLTNQTTVIVEITIRKTTLFWAAEQVLARALKGGTRIRPTFSSSIGEPCQLRTHRPGQHMEMFVAEFEVMAMRLEAIGHGVLEQMRVVNFPNSLSEVWALSAVLSALRVIDNISWTKATTQILLESELKGVNNNKPERPEGAMAANNVFTGTCYTCDEAGHRSSDHIDRGRH